MEKKAWKPSRNRVASGRPVWLPDLLHQQDGQAGADFDFSYNSIKERLGVVPIPVQIPIGAGDTFEGMVDLITMRAYFFTGEKGEVVEERDSPAELQESATMCQSD